MHTISKKFSFEATHRLVPPYSGKCSHLHGHCWSVRLFLSSQQLDERGFVRDFTELRPLREWIAENLDHSTLVSDRDKVLLGWLQTNNQKHFVLRGNPTSEILAQLLFETSCTLGLEVSQVEVCETESASAVYRR